MKNSPHFVDLSGQRFGRWTAIECSARAKRPGQQTKWKCRCDCGTVKKAVLYHALTNGGSKSCGCLKREIASRPNSVRQLHKREYNVWMSIKTRCLNEKHVTFANYGGRGITLCDEWKASFASFIRDMGPANGGTIERVDNNRGYEPSNCKWIPKGEQSRNRRSNIVIEWKGESMLLTDIARKENVNYLSMRQYWKGGKTLEEAVSILQQANRPYIERAAMRMSRHK